MKYKDNHIHGRAICYICISSLMGSYFYLLYVTYKVLSAAFAALFFLTIFKTTNKKFVSINMMIFVISIVNIHSYYNINLPSSYKEVIRIIEKNGEEYIGKCRGKLVQVYSHQNLKEGEVVKGRVNFTKKSNIIKGYVGYVQIVKIENFKDTVFLKIEEVKRKLHYKYSLKFGKEKSGIIMALSLGETKYISKKFKNKLSNLGVIHATAVSGFHVGIVFALAKYLFGGYTAVVLIFLYVFFTGAKVSAVRALIMICIYYFGIKIYRKNDAVSSLAFSALIVLNLWPYLIVDIGFALSYLSMLGIILYKNKILRVFYKLPHFINESLSIALASQVFSFPYIMIVFNQMNLSFLLGNLFLIPLISIIIILGNLVLFISKFKIIFDFLVIILNFLVSLLIVLMNIFFKFSLKNVQGNYIHAAFYLVAYSMIIYYKRGEKVDKLM